MANQARKEEREAIVEWLRIYWPVLLWLTIAALCFLNGLEKSAIIATFIMLMKWDICDLRKEIKALRGDHWEGKG